MTWCGLSDSEHRVRLCAECRRVYQAHRRANSPIPIRRNRKGWRPSALNIRTTRKHQRCQENGGCIPSRVMVIRPFATGYFQVPECRKCKVPMVGALRRGWAA